jgi:hypothetical protein
MVRPDGPSARHNPLKDYRAVPGLCLKPDGLVRHDPFYFYAVRASSPKALARSGAGWAGPGRHSPLARYSSTCSAEEATSPISCLGVVAFVHLITAWWPDSASLHIRYMLRYAPGTDFSFCKWVRYQALVNCSHHPVLLFVRN